MSIAPNPLENAHKQLLVRLHAANAAAPRHEHEFTIRSGEYVGEADRVIVGGGLQEPLPALDADVDDLEKAGLLRFTGLNYVYGNRFLLTPAGVRYAERLSESSQLRSTAERAAARPDAREAIVLRWLHDDAPAHNLTLALANPVRMEVLPEFDGRELDQLLDDACRDGAARGERRLGDGSEAYWSGLQITAHGLERIGEWDRFDPQSTWNRRDRLVLRAASCIRSTTPRRSASTRGSFSSAWIAGPRSWTSHRSTSRLV